jgi:YHS domain-containing protein
MKKIILASIISIFTYACNTSEVKVEKQNTPTPPITSRFANTKDPNCSMDVTNDYTDTLIHDGKVFGFCSASCKTAFEKNPAAMIDKCALKK